MGKLSIDGKPIGEKRRAGPKNVWYPYNIFIKIACTFFYRATCSRAFTYNPQSPSRRFKKRGRLTGETGKRSARRAIIVATGVNRTKSVDRPG